MKRIFALIYSLSQRGGVQASDNAPFYIVFPQIAEMFIKKKEEHRAKAVNYKVKTLGGCY